MTNWHQRCKRRNIALACAAIMSAFCGIEGRAASFPRPSEDDLVRLIGERLLSGVPSARWETADVPRSNLTVYAVEHPRYDKSQLLALASRFGVKGEVRPLPADFLSAPGYWIKQPNATNPPWFKAVSFSEKSGNWGFAGDVDDHRWDLKNHRPLVRGVPTPDEALARTLQLLPLFRITTNDLERTSGGKLRWAYTTDGTSYNDRTDGKKKRFIRRINVMLWQRIHDGASTLSIGGGGMFEASYISEGQLASVKFLFRKASPAGAVRPMSQNQIVAALKRGDARSFQPTPMDAMTITNCALVYPQHNSDHKQSFIWPFYEVKGFSMRDGETNSVRVFVQPQW